MNDATTQILARFACGFDSDMLPDSAYQAAKKCLLDLAAAAVAGLCLPASRAVLEISDRLFAPGRSDVWFTGKTLNAPGAAYVNSTFASASDLDDGHRQAMGHPGASIIPAALAAAQETGASGTELLAAIIIGYEVAIRIASARDHTRLDTLSSGRWCAYGAAAAGGRLQRMPTARLAQALAIAGVQSPGLSAAGYSRVMGNSAKEGIPWATLTGLCALWLTDAGFTGPTDILDHPDYYAPAKIVADLGKRFAIEDVYFKPYACCRWIHAAIDALNLIMTENGLNAGMLSKLEVYTFLTALERLNNDPDPNSLEGAQYSIPFCLAAFAIEDREGLLPLKVELLGRGDIIALAQKIQLYADPELTRLFPGMAPARVVAHTSRGVFTRRVESPKGDPSNPMDLTAIENKLGRLARQNRPGFLTENIRHAIDHIENSGIDALMAALK